MWTITEVANFFISFFRCSYSCSHWYCPLFCFDAFVLVFLDTHIPSDGVMYCTSCLPECFPCLWAYLHIHVCHTWYILASFLSFFMIILDFPCCFIQSLCTRYIMITVISKLSLSYKDRTVKNIFILINLNDYEWCIAQCEPRFTSKSIYMYWYDVISVYSL